jgi:hypothetical protein
MLRPVWCICAHEILANPLRLAEWSQGISDGSQERRTSRTLPARQQGDSCVDQRINSQPSCGCRPIGRILPGHFSQIIDVAGFRLQIAHAPGDSRILYSLQNSLQSASSAADRTLNGRYENDRSLILCPSHVAAGHGR